MNTGRTHFKKGQSPYPHKEGCLCRRCARGENHSNWKGDKAVYRTKHGWMVRHYGQPKMCEDCSVANGHDSRYFHWANISGEYRRDRNDWRRLCARCHAIFDGRSKLKFDDLPKIKKLRSDGFYFREIADVFGVSRSLAFQIAKS